MTLAALRLTERHWWHGIVDLEALPDGGARAWRVPYRDPRYAIGLDYAGTPAGARIVAETDATAVRVQLRTDQDDPCPLDVLVDGARVARLPVTPGPDGTVTLATDLPAGHRVELWLPQYGCSGVLAVEFDGGRYAPAPVAPSGPRLLVHGSSITMCRQADGPTTAWPSRIALEHGWDLLNLAYAGTCLLDQPVARLIRDTPADMISLCLGVNVQTHGSHSARSLLPAVIGFLETVLDGHPDIPVVVVTPIAARPEREAPGPSGLTLSQIRGIVADGVQRVIDARPAPLVRLVDGRELLGEDELDLLVDTVHPGDAGCAVLAERIAALFAN